MYTCEDCGSLRFNDKSCPCIAFTVIDEEGEDHTVFGVSKDDAATKFAEWSNVNGDYHLMNESVEITVDGEAFVISAEPEIHYSARKS